MNRPVGWDHVRPFGAVNSMESCVIFSGDVVVTAESGNSRLCQSDRCVQRSVMYVDGMGWDDACVGLDDSVASAELADVKDSCKAT